MPVQKPITVKIGAFFPTDGNARDAVGKTWFGAGADYAFRKTDAAAPILPLVYVDYAGKSGNGLSLSTVGAGIGAYFLNASGGGTSDNNTVLGGKVNVGVELNQGPFLEAAYQVTGKYKNSSSNANGLSFMVGDRF